MIYCETMYKLCCHCFGLINKKHLISCWDKSSYKSSALNSEKVINRQ